MNPDPENNLRLEIGHVLFIDLVGYSKLLIEEQRERLRQLTEIVLAAAQVREAPNEELIRLPTGDGMALVFRNSSEEPARCALEVAQALKAHPEIAVRMGIHSGPVSEVTDVSGRTNIAGAGINTAQRVMDCGDAGHILLSQRVAEDLAQYRQWAPRLHDLGECEVKHGVRLHLVNLYAEELGNSALPRKFQQAKEQEKTTATARAPERRKLFLILTFSLICLAIVVLIFAPAMIKSLSRERTVARLPAAPSPTPAAIPEKSIAVLPFENLSEEKANAYFADGIQDEILTNLARIADLKVISRTSVAQYKGAATRNLSQIAETLKVAHVLEGSVQRSANRVRVNAQLIDARTDAHLWAQTYDRELADVFAIQSEIAKTIADQLQAKLSPSERASLQAKPTNDLTAYDLYLRAKEIARGVATASAVGGVEDTKREIPLLEEAIRRDPTFVQALCLLSRAHLYVYWQGDDRTPARLEAAARALEQAARLQPDGGEVHLARGQFFYHGRRDYASALRELAAARERLPNDSTAPFLIAMIKRRQGHFEEAILELERVLAADPRDINTISEAASTFLIVRRLDEAARVLDRALTWKPDDFALRFQRAFIQFYWKADLGLWKELVASEWAQTAVPSDLAYARFELAILQRDYHAAEGILAGGNVPEFDNNGFFVPKEWNEAIVARGLGDAAKATAKFQAARDRAAAKVREQTGSGQALMVLAQIDAALGRKEDAIREGQQASEQLPVSKDAIIGAQIFTQLAGIYARVGETDRAFESLKRAAQIPNGASYGRLKLSETWDPLRGDPRFEAIVASLAPK